MNYSAWELLSTSELSFLYLFCVEVMLNAFHTMPNFLFVFLFLRCY